MKIKPQSITVSLYSQQNNISFTGTSIVLNRAELHQTIPVVVRLNVTECSGFCPDGERVSDGSTSGILHAAQKIAAGNAGSGKKGHRRHG